MIKIPARRRLYSSDLVLIASIYPRKSTPAAGYEVKVADNTGRGLPGVMVRRYIQDYSSGRNIGHSVEVVTDLHGHASFPREDHRASIAGQILGCGKQVLTTGAHASCGMYSDISVSDNHLVEAARVEKQLQHGTISLSLTMSGCPSGDYWACADSVRNR